MIVEIILFGHGGTTEMAYPIVTIVGAAVMALSSEHRATLAATADAERDDSAFQREEKRKDNELKRQLKLEKARAKLSHQGVAPTVANSVASNTSPAGDTVEMRHLKLLNILQSCGTPSAINKTAIARQLGVSRHTVIRDIQDLEARGRLSLNGVVKVAA